MGQNGLNGRESKGGKGNEEKENNLVHPLDKKKKRAGIKGLFLPF